MNGKVWILIKFRYVIDQMIRLNKLCKLMESFFLNSVIIFRIH